MAYPAGKYRYEVECKGLNVGGFTEVSGFDASIDVIEYREGNEPTQSPQKVPGLKKYGNITLKKGVFTTKEMYDWMSIGVTGAVTRQTLTIKLKDEANADVATWQIINAWPCKYTAPDFNATSSEIAVESLELAHEGMTRTK